VIVPLSFKSIKSVTLHPLGSKVMIAPSALRSHAASHPSVTIGGDNVASDRMGRGYKAAAH
jgi:hypothetical protein